MAPNLEVADVRTDRVWLTIRDVAAELGVGRQAVYNLIFAGKLKAVQVNSRGDYRIRRESLDSLGAAQ